jgi:hypothetical protein
MEVETVGAGAGAGSETGVGATGSGVEAEALDAGGAGVCVTHSSADGWTCSRLRGTGGWDCGWVLIVRSV